MITAINCSEHEFLNVKGAQESIPPAYVAWRAGDNPIPTRFLAPIECSKIPALVIVMYSIYTWFLLLASVEKSHEVTDNAIFVVLLLSFLSFYLNLR